MNEEKHICVYCGHEAHYQFKNGKWCCSKNQAACPANRKRNSEKNKILHTKQKELTGSGLFKKDQRYSEHLNEYKFSGDHICVHCGQYAAYQLKGGQWCCQPIANKCPEVRKRFANKPGNIRKRDYKARYRNLPEETKRKMSKSFRDPISREKGRQTLLEGYRSGRIIPSWKGRKHTEDEKDRIRISTVKYFEEIKKTGGAKVSKTACAFIDKLNESKGWHLQHGMNGGEIIVGGYYLDGYDKELNIAFEYDEPAHYIDIQNNTLKERDIRRMNYIHEKLNCRFFRYNERIDLLYEVTF